MKTFRTSRWSLLALALTTVVSSVSADKGIKGVKVAAIPPAQAPRDERELQAHAPTIIQTRKLQTNPVTKMPPNGATINSIKINGQSVTHNGVVPVPAPATYVDCSRYGTGQLGTGYGRGGKGKGKGGSRRNLHNNKKRGHHQDKRNLQTQTIPVECQRQPGFVAGSRSGRGKGGKGKNGKLGRSGRRSSRSGTQIIPVQPWNGRYYRNGRASGAEAGDTSSEQQGTNMKGAAEAGESAAETINLVKMNNEVGGDSSSSAIYRMATATIMAAFVALFVVL